MKIKEVLAELRKARHDDVVMKSGYCYSLHDCGAVKSADLIIRGITVIAGPNGSGKTTIAKRLCRSVNAGGGSDASRFFSRAILIGDPTDAHTGDVLEEIRSVGRQDGRAGERSERATGIIAYISDLLKGEVRYAENGYIFHPEHGDDIPLKRLASGYLPMAYIYCLLADGILGDRTLLTVDTPEAHLHPQWIAELARILVRLNNEVGVKIMIATHSPYMVEGIRIIAKGEGVAGTTLFYIAEPDNTSPSQYSYRCLNHDTNEIFDTFNTVYDKIDFYGRAGI